MLGPLSFTEVQSIASSNEGGWWWWRWMKVKKNSYREKMAAFQFACIIKTKTYIFFSFAKPGWSLRMPALAQKNIKTARCVTSHSFSAFWLFLPGKLQGSNNMQCKTLLSWAVLSGLYLVVGNPVLGRGLELDGLWDLLQPHPLYDSLIAAGWQVC